MTSNNHLPVAVIGGGPIGMAAIAHLAKRKIPFMLFESGDSVGSTVLSWRHVRIFSPWKYNIDTVARELLLPTGWEAPLEDELPTGLELVKHYLEPLSELPDLKPFIYTRSRVVSVGKKGYDKLKSKGRAEAPFVLRVMQSSGAVNFEAVAVIDATGTWLTPNPIGSGGFWALGEKENQGHIFYGIPDVINQYKTRYANKSVAVIGGGHSAINTVLELEKLKTGFPETVINWILRKQSLHSVYGGKDRDALEARGALGVRIEALVNSGRINVYTPFHIEEIQKVEDKLLLIGQQHHRRAAIPQIDEIIVNAGSRPDLNWLRELRLNISNSLESVENIAGLIDPNIHSCGTVRAHGELELRHEERNFYIVGSKSYGRAPTFLMATGYEQVRSVVAALAGDNEAARRVELNLPETGVCTAGLNEGSCCGVGPDIKEKTVCCE